MFRCDKNDQTCYRGIFLVGLICGNRDTSCEKVQMSQDGLEDHGS